MKYVGDITWYNEESLVTGTVSEAIINGSNLMIDCKESEFSYQLSAKTSEDFLFIGSWKYVDDIYLTPNKVELRYYHNDNKACFTGSWIEEGDKYEVIIELEKVE